jgi:hypothetical protein
MDDSSQAHGSDPIYEATPEPKDDLGPKRKKRRHVPTRRIIYALRKSFGLVSQAAKSIPCSEKTIRTRALEDPRVQQVIDESREQLIDMAEFSYSVTDTKKKLWELTNHNDSDTLNLWHERGET